MTHTVCDLDHSFSSSSRVYLPKETPLSLERPLEAAVEAGRGRSESGKKNQL